MTVRCVASTTVPCGQSAVRKLADFPALAFTGGEFLRTAQGGLSVIWLKQFRQDRTNPV
jgi:hypothetical protein